MRKAALAVGLMVLSATPACAQPEIVADSGDSAWVLAASLIVLFAVIPGLALFHGRGRAGPTGFALFGGISAASLVFASVGYSIAFGAGGPYLGGLGNVMLGNLAELPDGLTISEPVYVVFETVIALFAVAILCASVAERARPSWLIPFIAVWMLLVYVPVARWLWAGWLADLGAIDYAGGIVVQATAGTAALVVALLLRAKSSTDLQHDSRLAVAGAALVWIGFLALLGGAALGGSDDAAAAMLNGHFAASASVVVGMGIERVLDKRVTVYGAANSAVAGLAAVSAGCGVVGTGGAMLLGALGALAYFVAGRLTARGSLGSAVAGFTIHGAPAIVGALAFPLVMLPAFGGPGFVEGSGLIAQLAAQGVAVVAVLLWTIAATAIAALTVSVVAPMRLDRS